MILIIMFIFFNFHVKKLYSEICTYINNTMLLYFWNLGTIFLYWVDVNDNMSQSYDRSQNTNEKKYFFQF